MREVLKNTLDWFATVSYRPIRELLASILFDDEFNNLGFMATMPMSKNNNIICSTYVQSEHYYRPYHSIRSKFEDVLVLPFLLWSDSGQFISKSGNQSAHAVCLMLLSFSSSQQANKEKGMNLLGFMNQFEKVTTSF